MKGRLKMVRWNVIAVAVVQQHQNIWIEQPENRSTTEEPPPSICLPTRTYILSHKHTRTCIWIYLYVNIESKIWKCFAFQTRGLTKDFIAYRVRGLRLKHKAFALTQAHFKWFYEMTRSHQLTPDREKIMWFNLKVSWFRLFSPYFHVGLVVWSLYI